MDGDLGAAPQHFTGARFDQHTVLLCRRARCRRRISVRAALGRCQRRNTCRVAFAQVPETLAVVVNDSGADDHLVLAVGVNVGGMHPVHALAAVLGVFAAGFPVPFEISTGVYACKFDQPVGAALDQQMGVNASGRLCKEVTAVVVVFIPDLAVRPGQRFRTLRSGHPEQQVLRHF